MWTKWLPWRWVVRNVARRRGFLDPITLMSRLQRFAQPSEVAAPTELLRSGAVLHARGLMNSQAIQHNLDWIWPFWVERQFNPTDDAFVPRAFSITHINLTHRNWTAVGMPGTKQWPIVDPRGLVTPLYDGWSLDAWIIGPNGTSLFPSRAEHVHQTITTEKNLAVTTQVNKDGLCLTSQVRVVGLQRVPVGEIVLTGASDSDARLVITLRPYNTEGVSFVHDIAWYEHFRGWVINDEDMIYFDHCPGQFAFANYKQGDVYGHLPSVTDKTIDIHKGYHQENIHCEVGMATAAALYPIKGGSEETVVVHVPLTRNNNKEELDTDPAIAVRLWEESMHNRCQLNVPDSHIRFLYDNALRTLILHSPGDVFPGPFTYKRFWFRDAAFILNAMLSVGFIEQVRAVLNRFPSRQKQMGYFLSQEGEWDSNGEALWILHRYCQLTDRLPDKQWREAITKGGLWISRKRMPEKPLSAHAGLLPAGFSAEHLGPNDYYYWDDFWGVAGLKACAALIGLYGDHEMEKRLQTEALILVQCIEQSLSAVQERLRQKVIPASPYRRLDAGAIGSLVMDYPLRLCPVGDARMMNTVEFLLQNCMVNGGFFQDMTHSGINPYLTLHMAQVLLRAGDARFFDLMMTVARLASPTGQWPEAVHPRTKGGCMGDGQHVWAAAEWICMINHCFVREENNGLVLASGIVSEWLKRGNPVSLGPVHTSFGTVSVSLDKKERGINVAWTADWFRQPPPIQICLPGYKPVMAQTGASAVHLEESVHR